MEIHIIHDDERAELIASARYTQRDLVIDGTTALATVIIILTVLFQLGCM